MKSFIFLIACLNSNFLAHAQSMRSESLIQSKVRFNYFVPNAPSASKQRIESPEVTAFIPSSNGRMLFTSKGVMRVAELPSDGKALTGKHGTGRITCGLGFSGAKKSSGEPRLEAESGGKASFFLGAQDHWQAGLPLYRELVYDEVWQGISLTFVGAKDQLTYRLVLAPGADPAQIDLETGATALVAAKRGIVAHFSGQNVALNAPTAFQEWHGQRLPVDVQYQILPQGHFGFTLKAYNPKLPLIIEPDLAWLIEIGSASQFGDDIRAIATDASGALYITGLTQSTDFPVTAGTLGQEHASAPFSGQDIFISKLSSDGSELLLSSYLGGEESDYSLEIGADDSGNVFLSGVSYSSDFPVWTTPNDPHTPRYFAVKFNPELSGIVYSRVTAGNPAIAVSAAGDLYLAGSTDGSLTTTAGCYAPAYSGNGDGFVSRLDPTGTPIYTTYLGGASADTIEAIHIDDSGNAYVSGHSASADFPTTPGAYSQTNQGDAVFVCKINSTGSTLEFGTFVDFSGSAVNLGLSASGASYLLGVENFRYYLVHLSADGSGANFSDWLGEENEYYGGLAVDPQGNYYLAGYTTDPSFVTTPAAFDQSYSLREDVFVRKFDVNSNLVYSTLLGGRGSDAAHGIIVNPQGEATVVGLSDSTDFPTTAGAYMKPGGNNDGFVTRLNSGGSALLFSTMIGGSGSNDLTAIATAPDGSVILAGAPYQTQFVDEDVYVSKLTPSGDVDFIAFFGGGSQDAVTSIAVDPVGDIYLTGWTLSMDFPTKLDAFDRIYDGTTNGFVAKLSADGSDFIYGTYLGGADTYPRTIAVDAAGHAFLGGKTGSEFPVTVGAYDETPGTSKGFVTKLDATASSLLYSTFLGDDSQVNAIDLDDTGNAWLTGTTTSSGFPVTAGAYDQTYGGQEDVFVAKLNSSGSALLASTFLGDVGSDFADKLKRDSNGEVLVHGYTYSPLFPTTLGAYRSTYAGAESFYCRFDASLANLHYATFLGGNATDRSLDMVVDSTNAAYFLTVSFSLDFPNTSATPGAVGAYITKFESDDSLAFSKLLVAEPGTSARLAVDANDRVYCYYSAFPSVSSDPAQYYLARLGCSVPLIEAQPAHFDRCLLQSAAFSVTATGEAVSYQWLKDGVEILGAHGATYTIDAVALEDAGDYSCLVASFCAFVISETATLGVGGPLAFTEQPQSVQSCPNQTVQFQALVSGEPPLSYQWTHNGTILADTDSDTLELPTVSIADEGDYVCYVTDGHCVVHSETATLQVTPFFTLNPLAAVQGLNTLSLEVGTPCGSPEVEWLRLPEEFSYGLGVNPISLDPAPLVTTDYQALIRDGGVLVFTQSVRVLVAAHPEFFDFNEDGLNNLADLWLLASYWGETYAGDPNQDGVINVLDLLYINTEEPLD